ncbi:MAG: cysteine--tRNA ligase, partial [Peptoniphilaceae bacterium]|nr:cysteine--tRNA ligase [Peptoniphilaceae bacterium]MDY5766521.1 DALR domain-containing protein [Peptoniphilaceae bacterium]
MDDDLNTADALTAIYEIIRIANQSLNEQSGKAAVNAVYQIFMELFEVLGLEDRSETVLDEEIERLIAERGEARKNRDFQRADEIRDQLKAKGILLKDTPTGVTWSRE